MSSLKAPKICRYCGKPGKMSAEHVLPNWLRNVLPPRNSSHTRTHTRTTYNGPSGPLIDRQTTNHAFHVGQRKLRDVCAKCNNGWMRALQDQNLALLTKLIRGEWDGINAVQAASLSNWAAMIAANIDGSVEPPHGVTIEARRHLAEAHTAPDDWTVRVGMVMGNIEDYEFWPRSLRGLRKQPDGTEKEIGFVYQTIELGRLVILVTNFPFPAIEDQFVGMLDLKPWGGDDVAWRSLPRLPQNLVLKMAFYFNNISALQQQLQAAAGKPKVELDLVSDLPR